MSTLRLDAMSGSKLREDLHPSLFTFLQNRHSLRNRRAKAIPKESECYFLCEMTLQALLSASRHQRDESRRQLRFDPVDRESEGHSRPVHQLQTRRAKQILSCRLNWSKTNKYRFKYSGFLVANNEQEVSSSPADHLGDISSVSHEVDRFRDSDIHETVLRSTRGGCDNFNQTISERKTDCWNDINNEELPTGNRDNCPEIMKGKKVFWLIGNRLRTCVSRKIANRNGFCVVNEISQSVKNSPEGKSWKRVRHYTSLAFAFLILLCHGALATVPTPSSLQNSTLSGQPTTDPPWDPCAGATFQGKGLGSPWLRMEVTHHVFDVGALVPGLVYGVSIEWAPGVQMGRLVVTSRADGSPSGSFTSLEWRKGRPSSPGIVTCAGAAVVGPTTLRDRESFSFNWTLPAVGSQVLLRVIYLPLEPALTESSVVTSDLSMGVVSQSFRLLSVCDLSLSKIWGTLSWKDIETASSAFGGGDCTVHFPTRIPSPSQPMGLLVELTRLNVACSLGHLQFGPSARHVYCGKLEEYRASERQVYMKGDEGHFVRVHSRVEGRGRFKSIEMHPSRLQVSFSLRYRPVEPCYNVSLTAQNGSFLIPPQSSSFSLSPPFHQSSDRVRCTLTVHLPYGYKVSLSLRLLGSAEREEAAEQREEEELSSWRGGEERGRRQVGECKNGLVVSAWEDGFWWSRCLSYKNGIVSETSEGNRVSVKVYWSDELEKQADGNELPTKGIPSSILIEYVAVEIPAIVGECGFGWVSVGSRWGAEKRRAERRKATCVGAMESHPLSWAEAEAECVRLGGHLASVRSEEEQAILDLMLTKSPGYHEHNSYWVGASDAVREGDFQWTDGSEFRYSNWFPGWASHGHYNRQPNDDGLSGQDCVELRRAYQLPSAPPPSSSAHGPHKYALRPRRLETGELGIGEAVGEGVAPHRLSATYAWNDRDCTAANYYVCEKELPSLSEVAKGKGVGGEKEVQSSGAGEEDAGGEEVGEDTSPGRHQDCNRKIRLGGVEKKGVEEDVLSSSTAIVTSPNFPAPYPDEVHCETLVTAPSGFRLLLEFEELVLEDEPTCSYDYLEIQDLGPEEEGGTEEEAEMRRLCGDWSSRLKLLRHVTSGRSLRLRFVSDYSHRFGGFRARVSMLSAYNRARAATIECADNRLQPFNNSCYLFVGYPEVTWSTAQQICQGMKAELASILSPEEYRFITSSIRGSDQYSNSAMYWLGGKLQGKEWQWVDGSRMDFQAWLPDSGMEPTAAQSSPFCLGIRWRQSPAPRLHPSGLHWSAERCSTVGGYVCKKRKGWMGIETLAKGSPTSDLPNDNDEKDSRRDALLSTISLKGESGVVTSPGFPEGYPPDVRALIRIEGPPMARLFIRFTALDLEEQPDCLYDYVEVREIRDEVPKRADRWCGSHSTDLERFDFVSDTNIAEVFFRSDYSVSGAGFSAMWHAVDMSGCPAQTLAASSASAGETSGVLTSPNHPVALIPRLDCRTTLLAPTGRHVWLEFTESEVVEGGEVELWLGTSGRRPFRPFSSLLSSETSSTISPIAPTGPQHLGDGVFLSAGNRMVLRLWTGDNPRGRGFKASFRAVGSDSMEEHLIILGNDTHGPLLHLNYPDEPPPNIHFVQRLLAPIGHVVRIRFQDVAVSSSEDGGSLRNPPQMNSTTTEAPTLATSTTPYCGSSPHLEVRDRYADTGSGSSWVLCHSLGSVLSLTSYLNSLTVVQRPVTAKDSPKLNAVVTVAVDPNHKMKLLRISEHEMRNKENSPNSRAELDVNNRVGGVESCNPNPCLHGGKCVGGAPGQSGKKTCQCKGHYTGLFCALTMCDLEPCIFGVCVLSGESGGLGFRCRCFPGYTGTICDERPKPCADNPCEGRGDCLEKGPHSFVCRCHAWWEGSRCERRMLRIPYKPLSERMLHEPFWLGLITVTVVLGIIGLIWCAKRHFPEKLEKLLAEEADRSRHGVSTSSSARDNLQSIGGPQPYGVAVEGSHYHHHHQAHPGGQQQSIPSRSLFGRLGIRKPSLLSLTGGGGTSAQMQQPQPTQSTQPLPCPNNKPAIPDRKPNAPVPANPTPKACSQHGSGGSPSSRKKRNNSSPTRKHSITSSVPPAAAVTAMAEDEKKKILQSLVTPAHKPILSNTPRLSVTSLAPSETLVLGECPPTSGDSPGNVSETKFMGGGGAAGTSIEEVVLEEPLPGPPLMPPVPLTASRLDKKVTFARLLSRVSAEMGSSSASGSGSEATQAPKPHQDTATPVTDSQNNQHLPSPASDESSSVSSSTSSSSYHVMVSSGTSPSSNKRPSRTNIQVPVVNALGRDGISSTRGPSILLEPPSSSMCSMDFPPLSPIREMPSPYPSPTKGGLHSKEEERREMKREEDTGDTDDIEEEEDDEEPARVCLTQSPEEEGGGGEDDEGEEEDNEGEDEDGEDDKDDETEDDEEDEDYEEEQEGKAEEDHVHHKQRTFSVDAAALEATDEDVGDEGLEEDSPIGLDTLSETTSTSVEKCCAPKLVPPLSLSLQPRVIPTITIQQPSPTKTMTPNSRPQMVLPIGSPPPRRRLSEHHPYTPPIFFQSPLSPQVSQPSNKRLLLHGPDKLTSLDLPMSPPIITVTATMSESDETEDGIGSNGRSNSSFQTSGLGTIVPSGRRLGEDSSKCGSQQGMTYLSPFSMCSRGERTASESNLSSSGYSSMASPGPSRAGSNNPLCPSDVTDAEDPHQHMGGHLHHGPHLLLPHHRSGQLLHPHHNASGSTSTLLHPSVQYHHQHYLNILQASPCSSSPTCSENDTGTPHLTVPLAYSWTRRPSPLLQTPNVEDTTVERPPGSPTIAKCITLQQPKTSGSEENNTVFEGSSVDEEEKRKEEEVGEGKRRRREERRNSSTTPDSNDEGIGTEGETGKAAISIQKTLQLPSIIVGVRGASPPPTEPEVNSSSRLSPVSSRSESPLSDRVSLPSSSPFGHNSSPRPFSALFFGKGPPLPLTDSDALYDCPSSEVLGGDDSSTGGHTAHTKEFPLGIPPPHLLTERIPGKGSNLLEVPHRQGLQRKISPKRRVRAPVPICSSSSSSSSLEGIHPKRPGTSSMQVQKSSRYSSSSEKNASKSIEIPYTNALQSPMNLHQYSSRKYKHLRGWVSPGLSDHKKCSEDSQHGPTGITLSPNASSSSAAITPLPHDDVNVSGDATSEIIGKDTKWIYGPDKIALHEALMLPLDDPLPQTRKICRMKTIGHQIRFLRRLELTLKRREKLVSPSDSDEGPHKADEDDEHDRKEDSSQSSSETTKVPLLQSALPYGKEGRYRSSFRRQRRAYERSGRGAKMIAPVLEPLLHQAPLSTSSEDEDDKPKSHSSPYRQRHSIHPSVGNPSVVGVTAVPNLNG